MNEIDILKHKSGRDFFASIIGKSTIKKDSDEYKMIQDATRYLVAEKNFGVIHGGYEGGAMSAVSEVANEVIEQKELPSETNIGVPQVQHEELWPRVAKAVFTDPAQDIQDRLRMVLAGDVVVVAPLGGDGTHLELTLAIHENIIKDYRNKHGHQDAVQPIIFICTKNGTDWKTLINTTVKLLDNSKESADEYEWIHFVNTLDDFKKIINQHFKNK
jgi:predicted Rossmann-fold nucleotide-binding protein